METDKVSSKHFSLEVKGLSKKFGKQKLFEQLNFHLIEKETLAIIGSNGSGKSSLLKIIAGVLPPTKGVVELKINNSLIEKDKIHQHINICAPYLSLIEEFTLAEHLNFHAKFKPLQISVNLEEEVKKSGLELSYHKLISDFSSGMKQRLKLILSFCYVGNLILLDEPTSHLDENGKKWYKNLVSRFSTDRMLIIFSNEAEEYLSITEKIINIESIKM